MRDGGPGNTWRLLDFLRLSSRLTAFALQARGLMEDFVSTLVVYQNGEVNLYNLKAIALRRVSFLCQESIIAQMVDSCFVAMTVIAK